MADFILATDSTADMPYETVLEYGIEVVPMEFLLGGQIYHHYPDQREISFHDFYDRISAGEDVSTSQINYYTYKEFFEPFLKAGKDILYICFTSGLSGTYQGACLAIEDLREAYPERKIEIVDSLCAAVGEGLLVYEAAQKKAEGLSLEELKDWTLEHRLKMRHWFVVENLDQLKKGGRISPAAAMIGTALGVKPLLSVNKEGKLVNTAKLRGAKKILETFCQKITADGENTAEKIIMIGHADNKEAAEKLAEELKNRGLIKGALIADIGPIIGAHVGKGMYAMVYLAGQDLEE